MTPLEKGPPLTPVQEAVVLSNYAAGIVTMIGWTFDVELLIHLGGWPTFALAVIGVLIGAAHPLIPVVSAGLGAVLLGGIRGALIGNALSVVVLEAPMALRVFFSTTPRSQVASGLIQPTRFPSILDAARAGMFDCKLSRSDLRAVETIVKLVQQPTIGERIDPSAMSLLNEQTASGFGLLLTLASTMGTPLDGHAVARAMQGPVLMAYWAARYWNGTHSAPLLWSATRPELEERVAELARSTRLEVFTSEVPAYLVFMANYGEQRGIRDPAFDALKDHPEVLASFGERIYVASVYGMILANAECRCASGHLTLESR